jgi:hypothetical protein
MENNTEKSESEVRAESEARADELLGMALRNLNKNALASAKEAKKGTRK